jgi:hypothetical protein
MSIINWEDFKDIELNDISPKKPVLPLDWYCGSLTSASVVLTKAGQDEGLSFEKAFKTVNPDSPKGSVYGAMLKMKFAIKQGKDTGTAQTGKTFETQMWFCLKKDNPGLNNIKKIAAAVGLSALPENTDSLCGNDFWMKIKIAPPQGAYGEKNEFDGAMSVSDMLSWAEKKGFSLEKPQTNNEQDFNHSESEFDEIPF